MDRSPRCYLKPPLQPGTLPTQKQPPISQPKATSTQQWCNAEHELISLPGGRINSMNLGDSDALREFCHIHTQIDRN
jgi:hypothetical protein